MENLSRYVRMAESGVSPDDLYARLLEDGVDEGAAIRMLREVYNLSLREMKIIRKRAQDGRESPG